MWLLKSAVQISDSPTKLANEWILMAHMIHIWQKIGFGFGFLWKLGAADDPDDLNETGFGFQLWGTRHGFFGSPRWVGGVWPWRETHRDITLRMEYFLIFLATLGTKWHKDVEGLRKKAIAWGFYQKWFPLSLVFHRPGSTRLSLCTIACALLSVITGWLMLIVDYGIWPVNKPIQT